MKVDIKNKRIINFFNEHSNLEVEDTLLKFIEIMEMLHEKMNSSMNNSTVLDILDNLKSMNSKIDNVSTNVNKISGETQTQFALKMGDLKKEYVNELQMILTCNVSDKIEPLFKEQNAALFDKTNAMINTIIPKNEEAVVKRIEAFVKDFQTNVANDTKNLLAQSLDEKKLEQYLLGFDAKLSKTVESSQQVLNSALTSTEQRLEKRIDNIRELSSSSSVATDTLNASVHSLLSKFENSSAKGKMSENLVRSVLEKLFPSADIASVGNEKETGDVIVTRANKPKILVENKFWTRPVIQSEVTKFIRDIEAQKCCGIFLSQNGKITTKNNFEINFHNGNVLVYVHDVHNDEEKIQIAVDIIDNLKDKLDEFEDETCETDSMPKEMIEYINSEYQSFAATKLGINKLAKDFHKNLLKQVDEIKLPTLEDYLSTKFSFSSNKFVCDYCDFVGKNQQSKSAHMRGCKIKKIKEEAKGGLDGGDGESDSSEENKYIG